MTLLHLSQNSRSSSPRKLP